MDLVDAEEVKKRGKEYTEELYKKGLDETYFQHGVVSHLETDILECEVKWALGSTAVNKASGCDGLPCRTIQALKDDAIKVLHSICQQFGKPSSGHKTGKGQFSSEFQRKAVLKNVQTIRQLCSLP